MLTSKSSSTCLKWSLSLKSSLAVKFHSTGEHQLCAECLCWCWLLGACISMSQRVDAKELGHKKSPTSQTSRECSKPCHPGNFASCYTLCGSDQGRLWETWNKTTTILDQHLWVTMNWFCMGLGPPHLVQVCNDPFLSVKSCNNRCPLDCFHVDGHLLRLLYFHVFRRCVKSFWKYKKQSDGRIACLEVGSPD